MVLTHYKNIPSDIKWEPNTVPPQYTDHADQVIEKGTSLRLKILGVKPDVAAINAIGTIKEDYLGWVSWHIEDVIANPVQAIVMSACPQIYTIFQALSDHVGVREILHVIRLNRRFSARHSWWRAYDNFTCGYDLGGGSAISLESQESEEGRSS